MEQTYKTRQRINFSTSVKGVVTTETTFEGIDMTQEDVIGKATKLYDEANKIARERTNRNNV